MRGLGNPDAFCSCSHGAGLLIAGLSGEGTRVIGALAAVGLNRLGRDGRCLWLRGLREAAGRRMSVGELADMSGLAVRTTAGRVLDQATEPIELGEWPRAVIIDHRPVLLVEEKQDGNGHAPWRVVSRELIKRH